LRRLAAGATALLVLLIACSSPNSDPTSGIQQSQSPSAKAGKAGNKVAGKKQSARQRSADKKVSSVSKSSAANEDDGSKEEETDTGTDQALVVPAAGRLVYAQEGYERFCQSGTCDKRDLPDRQPVEVSVKRRSDDVATVISEARTSDNRTARTTFRLTRSVSEIVELHTEFDYGAFGFSDTFRPKPPIESVRFPVAEGQHWKGSWEAGVSGDYEVGVLDRQRVMVADEQINAYRIRTITQFSGRYQGNAEIIVWLDVAGRTVVKSKGHMFVRSSFGTYETEFKTLLRAGPGYG